MLKYLNQNKWNEVFFIRVILLFSVKKELNLILPKNLPGVQSETIKNNAKKDRSKIVNKIEIYMRSFKNTIFEFLKKVKKTVDVKTI